MELKDNQSALVLAIDEYAGRTDKDGGIGE